MYIFYPFGAFACLDYFMMCSFSLHCSCERAKSGNKKFLSQHTECFYSMAVGFSSPFLKSKVQL